MYYVIRTPYNHQHPNNYGYGVLSWYVMYPLLCVLMDAVRVLTWSPLDYDVLRTVRRNKSVLTEDVVVVGVPA